VSGCVCEREISFFFVIIVSLIDTVDVGLLWEWFDRFTNRQVSDR